MCQFAKRGFAIWYCYRNAKSEVIQSFDYFLAQPQARQSYPSAFQEAQGTSKQSVTHSSPGGGGRGSCLAPGIRHTFTTLQTEKRPGSSHSQTPEATQRAANKRERTTPTVSLTNTTKTPQLSSFTSFRISFPSQLAP